MYSTAAGHAPPTTTEGIKQLLLSMFMLKSTTSPNSGDAGSHHLFHMMWSMIVLTLVDKLSTALPTLGRLIMKRVEKTIQEKSDTITQTILNAEVKKEVMSRIRVEIDLSKSTPENTNLLGNALLYFVTHRSNSDSILFRNNQFVLNHENPVLVDEPNEIYIKMKTMTATDGKDTYTIDVFSYILKVDALREYVETIQRDYALQIQNKLGNNLYYFNAIVGSVTRDVDGKVDYSRQPPQMTFTMKRFETNRRFKNVIGPQSRLIEKRVMFFRNNKAWYDDKGIPYTLGLLLSGAPGGGKTSTIKCVANELGRHIINIALHEGITKTQLENLFFQETIHIATQGRSEQFVIPIHKRLYVFEDIDCQGSDIVFDRDLNLIPLRPVTTENTTEETKPDEDDPLKGITTYSSGFSTLGRTELFGSTSTLTKPLQSFRTQTKQSTTDNKPILYDDTEKLTLSTLLNILDGILETPGRVIIMTSNYPKRLDRALIRPGRIDLICEFQKCDRGMMREFIECFYNRPVTEKENHEIQSCVDGKWTPAEITKIMFEHFEDPLAAIQVMKRM